jgi:hypothetical protein
LRTTVHRQRVQLASRSGREETKKHHLTTIYKDRRERGPSIDSLLSSEHRCGPSLHLRAVSRRNRSRNDTAFWTVPTKMSVSIPPRETRA